MFDGTAQFSMFHLQFHVSRRSITLFAMADQVTVELTRMAEAAMRDRRRKRRLRLPRRKPGKPPGSVPGVELGRSPAESEAAPSTLDDRAAAQAEPTEPVAVTCIDYGADVARRQSVEPGELSHFLSEPASSGTAVRWINVDGLSDLRVLAALANHYNLHPLAMEDVLQTHQRSKAETYEPPSGQGATLFVVMRMIHLQQGHVHGEQVSLFLGAGYVLTIQEHPGDVWDEVRQRIDRAGSRLRANEASFLLYALLDAVVDNFFPVLDHYADRLESLEDEVLNHPEEHIIGDIHTVKHELMVLRREVWPTRELVYHLLREDDLLGRAAQLYMRDVHDHTLQVIDLIESYHESASTLADTYMSIVSNRLNDVMKTLTIIASIFIPISFLAGVFGMNFASMPGQHSDYAFAAFCAACVVIAAGMAAWFKKKQWW